MAVDLTSELVELIESGRQTLAPTTREHHNIHSLVQNLLFYRDPAIFRTCDAAMIRKSSRSDLMNIETVLCHALCGSSCRRAVVVELWTVKVDQDQEQQGLVPLFLKNAIRSHLHFSQLSSWLAALEPRQRERYQCAHRRNEDGKLKSCAGGDIGFHRFPVARMDKERVITVEVQYVKRSTPPFPEGFCLPMGRLSSDQWPARELTPPPTSRSPPVTPTTLTSDSLELPLIQNLLKHKPLATAPLSPDGPAPKIPAIGDLAQRPTRRILTSGSLVTSPTASADESKTDSAAERRDDDAMEQLARRLHTLGDRGRVRTKSGGGHTFNKVTGLPVHSSPAPFGRQRNSMSASEAQSVERRRSAPSTSLLGSFEESALNRRLELASNLLGFTLQFAAAGSFATPHVSLPVNVSCFALEDSQPAPYLGTCCLDGGSKKGYRIPKKGVLQATLFNPQETVVKVFVIPYDMSDMPANSQTFIRHRTHFASESSDERHLVHLIHVRLSTDRRGRLYMHGEVRLLFSLNATLDGLNIEVKGQVGMDAGRYKLMNETQMPAEPKYSPRK